MQEAFKQLKSTFEGEFYSDELMRRVYATDASAYREMPLAVAIPKSVEDIKKIISFCLKHNCGLIPRTAGTSLAGQVVGSGIVVDVSKHFTQIIELNEAERWVRVSPGVVRDELNIFLEKYGLFFGPETSTANRAMIGGMVGNNSCGSNSIVYKSTREHLLELKVLLSDGSEAVFKTLTIDEFYNKCEGDTLEAGIYKKINQLLSDRDNRAEIEKEFPKPSVERRNTGYAVDILMNSAPFVAEQPGFNFCKLIAGSEGTLAFITEIKLNVLPLPPSQVILLCVHFDTVIEALHANIIAIKYNVSASELIDRYILDCTKNNIEQQKNRFFVEGDPGAILVIEFARNSMEQATADANSCIEEMKAAGLGFHYPLLSGGDTKKIWTLRKAGLGLLSNMPGDDKAVPVIEDTAVDVSDLPKYIAEFNQILKKYNLYSVHYAHAGSGELHLRPILNLKTPEGNKLFKIIAEEIALLVKKYRGSLSGEHGDGRLRGEFLQQMIGQKNYELLKEIKYAFDPKNIFNPNKIIDTPAMNTMLRYEPGQAAKNISSYFRFYNQTTLQHAEQCNGSGDCRKTHLSGGTMCPSYMASKNEKETTRARANILREYLTNSDKINPYNHQEIYEVMDLCLSCKGCKSECPSNVDVAKLKAEFLQHYYDENGVPFRARLISSFSKMYELGTIWPGAFNFFSQNKFSSNIIKKVVGFAPNRSLPQVSKATLIKQYRQFKKQNKRLEYHSKVHLFCDEFTNLNDAHIGIKAVALLEKLGYEVIVPQHIESGRSSLSKGLVKKAQKITNRNVELLKDVVTADAPLIGIEPSAILSFKDEYIDLAYEQNFLAAKELAEHVFYIDDFIYREIQKGKISQQHFTTKTKNIKLHGHCHQKALASVANTAFILSFPQNFSVTNIPSGCCGMAGSFGYEKEHYNLSMQVGNLVLFPVVNNIKENEIIAAPGTSCRHQIKDGTGKHALHPVEVLYDALNM